MPTKTVTLKLTAHTKFELEETLEVPADATPEFLRELAQERFNNASTTEYTQDYEHWQPGTFTIDGIETE